MTDVSSHSPVDTWNAALYDSKHSYVTRLGADLFELLAPQPGERILDLGCGTGHLTYKLSQYGVDVIGLDSSSAMIEKARALYPSLSFVIEDARQFSFDRPFDAVFSNAALHWMPQPERVAAGIYQALKPNGRFVAEFGGKDNIRALRDAVKSALKAFGFPIKPGPWYFPSIGEYSTLLEAQGFEVRYMTLFNRPTPLEDGAEGLHKWLEMFGGHFLAEIPAAQIPALMQHIEDQLRPRFFQTDHWVIDYRRLRLIAVKPGPAEE